MPEPTTKADPRLKNAPTEPGGPPDEEFWDKYNKRLEFPLSTVATVLLHVLVGTLIVLILLQMESKDDRSGVPVQLMSISGLDDYGAGSAGTGGREDPIQEKINEDPATALQKLLGDPSKLPEIQEKMSKLLDPTGNLPITAGNAVAYEGLEKAIRDKLIGAQRGTGNTPGKGIGGAGTGPGGTGADSTLGRNLRWTLRFNVRDGHDYLKQLQAMGAVILVPRPGTEQVVIVEDLSRPESRRTVGPDGLGQFANRLQFNDARPDAVAPVARALQLDFTPKVFFAIFTKALEDDLSRMERAFDNKQAEQIEETVFKVEMKAGGSFKITVARQKLRN